MPTTPVSTSPSMERVASAVGTTVSYEKTGSGPALVLAHGSFSDHHTNWEFVKSRLTERFTMYAIARRGRGQTPATVGHSVEDEAADVAAVIRAAGEPVFLLGHSYGAHCALAAALQATGLVRKLVLYEPPWPGTMTDAVRTRLEGLASSAAWDDFAMTFFRDGLFVPVAELDALRATDLWPPIIADANASSGDVAALSRYRFEPERFRGLEIPVLLQVGSVSPRHLFVTDALAAVLPDVRVQELPGQAHEGMTTAPDMYVEAVTEFLVGR